MSVVNVVLMCRNRSIAVTTLHSLLNLNGLCMMHGKHINVNFVDDKSSIPKLIKAGDRLVFFDYATNLDSDSLNSLIQPFDKGVQMMVYPAVREHIDWDMFRKKTLAGSTEGENQRGLHFDTDVGRKLYGDVHEVTRTTARVWAMDAKPVDKKLRGDKIPVKLPTASDEEMFGTLQKLGIKIGALTSATVICHYTYECLGNILEASGVQLNK
jgi:hypothetical protein